MKKSDREDKDKTHIKRDSLVKLRVKRGNGKTVIEEIAYFSILSLFDKYHNTWFMIEDDKREWYQNFPKNKLN